MAHRTRRSCPNLADSNEDSEKIFRDQDDCSSTRKTTAAANAIHMAKHEETKRSVFEPSIALLENEKVEYDRHHFQSSLQELLATQHRAGISRRELYNIVKELL